MTDYKSRLRIPIVGDSSTSFYNQSGTLIAIGYSRIVIGGRGPYVEFFPQQINPQIVHIPENEQWRLNNQNCYYVEYRTSDDANTMIYYQRKLVEYADYKIGMAYITPFELFVNNQILIERL